MWVELIHIAAELNSNAFDTVCLNDDEMRVQHFHNRVDELVQ
jgi:hypothetical protein